MKKLLLFLHHDGAMATGCARRRPHATDPRATRQVYDTLTGQQYGFAYCDAKERSAPRLGHARCLARPRERSEHNSSHWRHPGARFWRFECTPCVPCVPTQGTLAHIHCSPPSTHGLLLPSLALYAPVCLHTCICPARCTALGRAASGRIDNSITKPYQQPSGVKITLLPNHTNSPRA